MNRVDEQRWSLRVDAAASASRRPEAGQRGGTKRRIYICDRCGSGMFELNCKVICPNCGSRFDCSDLGVRFDEQAE